MRKFRAALVQMDSQDDRKANLDVMEQCVAEAQGNGAELVVFPETVEYIGVDMAEHASQVPGPVTERFAGMAKRYGVWLHAGSITERREGKPCNLSLVFGPDGHLEAGYRKLHLFDVEVEDGPSYRESDAIAAGNELVVARTELGSLGLSICYDLRFPRMYQQMAEQGAEVLIVSANFTDDTGKVHWEMLLRARAIENTCYVLACCQCGEKKAFRAHGHSMIIDPWGRILAEAGQNPEILYADLDPELLKSCRRQIPCLKNQRSDIYS